MSFFKFEYYDIQHEEDILSIHNCQRMHNIVIPSDLVFMLLNFNGFRATKGGWEFSIDRKNPISELDSFLTLKWLVQEYISDQNFFVDAKTNGYCDKFLKIALTHSPFAILIGTTKENLNEIYCYNFDEHELIYICESIFEFIEHHLIKVD